MTKEIQRQDKQPPQSENRQAFDDLQRAVNETRTPDDAESQRARLRRAIERERKTRRE